MVKNSLADPKYVFMWLEPLCNLKCDHCHNWRNHEPDRTLNIEDRKEIIEELHDWLGEDFTLILNGGEPFMYHGIIELINKASKNGIKTSLTSNGTLINKELSNKIIESELNFLSISLDSLEPEIHDKTRGVKGSNKRARKGIHNLKEEKEHLPKIYINTIIMKENLEEIPKLINWVEKMGLKGITFQPIAPSYLFGGEYKSKISQLIKNFYSLFKTQKNVENFLTKLYNSLNYEEGSKWYKKEKHWPDAEKAKRTVQKIIDMKKDGYHVKNSLYELKKFKTYFENPEKFYKEYVCSGCQYLTIGKRGEIKLCPKLDSIGNIFEDNLKDSWNSKMANRVRNKVKKCDKDCLILSLIKEMYTNKEESK